MGNDVKCERCGCTMGVMMKEGRHRYREDCIDNLKLEIDKLRRELDETEINMNAMKDGWKMP